MPTSIASLTERARRLMFGSQRDVANVLTSTINDSVTTVTVNLDTQNIAAGIYIEIDFEPMLVVDVVGQVLTVVRAMDGSTAASHTQGARVRVDPIVTNWDLFQSMQEELVDLSSPANGLFQVVPVELTPAGGRTYFNLDTALTPLSVIRARQEDTPGVWSKVYAQVVPGFTVGEFASTYALRLEAFAAGKKLRVWLRAIYGAITVTGDAETAGLTGTAAGLLSIGAAYRMTIGRELARSMYERQGDTRRANEVPPGAQRQGLTPIAALRQERISAERARLEVMWPGDGP